VGGEPVGFPDGGEPFFGFSVPDGGVPDGLNVPVIDGGGWPSSGFFASEGGVPAGLNNPVSEPGGPSGLNVPVIAGGKNDLVIDGGGPVGLTSRFFNDVVKEGRCSVPVKLSL